MFTWIFGRGMVNQESGVGADLSALLPQAMSRAAAIARIFSECCEVFDSEKE